MVSESPPTARQRQKADTRRALLEAAEAVFAAQSPATTPLDEVAAEAGVSKATLFFHFASRDDLLAALATELYLRVATEDVVDVGDDTLDDFLQRWLARQTRDDVRLIWQLGDLLADRPELLDFAYRDVETQVVARLRARGATPRAAAEHAAIVVPALMFVGRRVAGGLATSDEVGRFVRATLRRTR